MKHAKRIELEARLREPAPAPPAGLREAILREVPETLRGSQGGEVSRRWPRWALAASLATAVAAGWLVREMPRPDARGESTPVAAVAPPVAAAPVARESAVPPRDSQEVRSESSAPPQAKPGRVDPVAAPPAAATASQTPTTNVADAAAEAKSVTLERRREHVESDVAGAAPSPAQVHGSSTPRSRSQDGLIPKRQPEPVQAVEVPAARFEEAVGVEAQAPGVYVGRISTGTAVVTSAAPSTGGTREPNDRPYGDVFFQEYGTNPFVDPEEDPLSTFGLDVDTASYAVARRYLADGHLPPSEAVRVEEFVNTVPQLAERRAGREGGLLLGAEGAPTVFASALPERYRLLRFTVAAPRPQRVRRPAVLTFVVDTSGSMEREDRLGLVRRALEMLLDELEPEDRVGLVVYDDRARLLCEPTRDRERLRRELEALRPGGSTNAEEGLTLAYEVADRAYVRGAVNRVLLASDGVANVGATGPQSILERIGTAARRGIYLTTVGFGMGNYNDVLMEQLANRGDGQYAYVDTLEEARRVFRDNLTATLDTVARDAKAQVEFDPALVERYRLLGYENRDVADRQFRDDRVDAGEIGAGHLVSALYEVKLRAGAERRGGALANLRVRYRDVSVEGSGEVVERSRKLYARDLEPSWEQASLELRWAACAAQFAELLKGSYWRKDASWPLLARETRDLVRATSGSRREQAEELAGLVARAARLAGGSGEERLEEPRRER